MLGRSAGRREDSVIERTATTPPKAKAPTTTTVTADGGRDAAASPRAEGGRHLLLRRDVLRDVPQQLPNVVFHVSPLPSAFGACPGPATRGPSPFPPASHDLGRLRFRQVHIEAEDERGPLAWGGAATAPPGPRLWKGCPDRAWSVSACWTRVPGSAVRSSDGGSGSSPGSPRCAGGTVRRLA